ncbi:MAG: hypothetical protein Q8S31_07090 [Alphaproteobacteria bacterium]|nr:hypothetical protein [Alphaproteobacteria bacterium]
MKLFKSSALALLISIASLSPFKSNAYIVQFTDNIQMIEQNLVGHQESEYIFAENNRFNINECALQIGHYSLKNENQQEVGFLFVDDRLPGRVLQINRTESGDVYLSFNGDTSNIRTEIRSNGNTHQIDIFDNLAIFPNNAFDTEIIITTQTGQIIIPLDPDYVREAFVPAPAVIEQPAYVPVPIVRAEPHVPAVTATTTTQSTPAPIATELDPDDVRQIEERYTLIENPTTNGHLLRNLFLTSVQGINEKAFLLHKRVKNNTLKIEGMFQGPEISLYQSENGRIFANKMHALKSHCYNYFDNLGIDFILENISKNDLEFVKIDLDAKDLSIQQLYEQSKNDVQFALDEAAFYFPENFVRPIGLKAQKFIREAHNPFINFAERVLPYLKAAKNDDSLDTSLAQGFLAEYVALKDQLTAHFGANGQECYQHFASDLFIAGAANIINIDYGFLENIDREIKLALQGGSKKYSYKDDETVMNIKTVATDFHDQITRFTNDAAAQFRGEIVLFQNHHEVATWLGTNTTEINVAFDTSLRRHNNNMEIIPHYTDYNYMLWVASQGRFCYDTLIQYGLNEQAESLKAIFIEALNEQFRQCGSGMVGRMFIALNATLIKFGDLIQHNNDGEVTLIIRN